MAQEIERKFLVCSTDYKNQANNATRIIQGYLSSVAERTVRVRIKDKRGFLTIKGSTDPSGISRFEWEKEIDVEDALELIKLCEPGTIEKVRYEVKLGNHTFEVDEFYGDNEGLIVAEVELKSEDEHFEKPSWLGKEVTGDEKYYNSMLVRNPYCRWS